MQKFTIRVNGQEYDVEVLAGKDSETQQTQRVDSAIPQATAPSQTVTQPKAAVGQEKAKPAPVPEGRTTITAPMPGKVLSVKAKVGQSVNKGDLLLTLEAMKMENEIASPTSGKVADIRVSQNQTVKAGEVMVVIS